MKECETIIKEALKEGRFSLLESEAKHICSLHKIPTPKFYLTKNFKEAIEASRKIGFPIVLKIVSPQIIHKSDIGGVVLNIKDEKELKVKYNALIEQISRRKSSATIIGVIVEKMMPPSTEVIVGGVRDPQFGPSIMFGMGGIFVEVYNDVTFRVAPIDKITASNMISELKGYKILEGTRGEPRKDLDSIIGLLINVSDLICEHEKINQLDLNPVIVYSNSLCTVDCRIIIK